MGLGHLGRRLFIRLPPSDLPIYKMILTRCAVCATELGLTLGKKCGRCSTRYCGPECQVQHWKEGGHDKLCKKIKKAGGAEQFHADKKCTAAIAVAAEACYICTQAVHWKTKEGIVRGCSCRGTAGFAHVSCLAEQAKILLAEVEENNLGNKVYNERFRRWTACSLCEQEYHGVVQCALGWACWKTFVGRPETDGARSSAMSALGNGLGAAQHDEDALSVKLADLATRRRRGESESNILCVQTNISNTYVYLGRLGQALQMDRDIYCGHVRLNGEEHRGTLVAASNYASTLVHLKRFEEVKALLRKTTPVARRVLGETSHLMFKIRRLYARSLYEDDEATLDDLRKAATMLEEMAREARRVLGGAPTAVNIEESLRLSRAALQAREACLSRS